MTICAHVTINQDVDVQAVVDIAEEAGRAIMEIYKSSDVGVESKADDSPLTKADTAANRVICAGLARLCPHIPIISEENRQMPYEIRKKYEYCFIVDPLDGTKEFIKKNGQFTVMIGLVQGSRPILGVVHTPAQDRTHYAVKGQGAWVRDAGKPETATQIHCRAFQRDQPGLTILASASHMDPATAAFVKQFSEPKMLNLGSSLKMNIIAEGKGDLYPRFAPTSEWDTCAADIIVEEAGGQMVQADRSGEGQPGWLERILKTSQPLQYNKENILNPFFLIVGKYDLDAAVAALLAKGVDVTKPVGSEGAGPGKEEGNTQGGIDCSIM